MTAIKGRDKIYISNKMDIIRYLFDIRQIVGKLTRWRSETIGTVVRITSFPVSLKNM